MNTRQLSLLFAVFASYVTTDATAFDVAPASFTSSEGTQQTLQITVERADWVYVGQDTACGTDFEFKIDLVSSGTATWSNDQVSGDLNLDLNNAPLSLTNQIILCVNRIGDFPPALVNQDYSINLHDDEIIREGNENAMLTFNGNCDDPNIIGQTVQSAGAKNPKTQATKLCPASVSINIVDETPVPLVNISAVGAAEPNSNGGFVLSLQEPAPTGGLVVNYSISSSSTATPSEDYVALGSTSTTIPVGETRVVIPVIVIDDELIEDRESVIVTILPSTPYDLGSSSSATVFIDDDDVLPQVSISASNGAEPSANGAFTFTLNEPAPTGGVVVNYSVSSSSTATASEDYEALISTSTTIPTGETSAVIPVVVIDDDLVEDRESVIVTIQPSATYEFGSSSSATVFIDDEDVFPEVSISASNGAEPSANGMFTITLNEPAPDAGLTVSYVVSETSTATASIDYEALGSSILIPAAGLSVDIPVIVINDDIEELAETVIVEIQDGSDYELGSPVTAVVSLVDDDNAGVEVSGGPLTVSEDGSSDQFSVVLTSQPLSDVNISVSSENTIEATVDAATLVFNASNWNIGQTVTVTGVDDGQDDGDADLNIMLNIASNDTSYATIAPIEVAVTNLDDDDPAAAAFLQEDYPFTEDTGSAEIIIERVGAIGESVSATFSTDDGASGTTATAGEDYTSVSEQLVWEPNDETSRTVEIPIVNDAFSEGDETVVLKLEVNNSELPAVFSKLVIQNDFVEDAFDAIDPENLPPNQRSISLVILTACPTGEGQGGFQELCNDLIGEALQGGSVGSPLKQITPDQSAAARAPAAETVTVQNINVNGRMAALRAGATGFSASGFSINFAGLNLSNSLFQGGGAGYDSINAGLTNTNAHTNANAGSNDDLFDDFGRWGVFVSGRAVFGDKDPTASESGYDFNTAGLTIGIDYRFSDKFVGGVAFGYSDNSVKTQQKSGRLDSTGLTGTLYGSYYPSDRFYMDVSVSSGSNDYDQQRQIDYKLSQVGAVVSETLRTDYDGDETGFTFGTGYDFSKNGWNFGPTLFVEYVDISIDAYDERLIDGGGAGFTLGWATHIKKQEYESLIPSIGFQFSKAWSRSWGVIIPQGHVSWAKELKNDDTIISGYFLGDTGQVGFELLTDALDEDFFKAGIGFSAMFQNNKSAFLMVDGDFGRDLLSVYYINAGFRWEF